MTKLNNLFEQPSPTEGKKPVKTLNGTAQLTMLATNKANELWKKFEADPEQYADTVAACKVDTNALDDIVKEHIEIANGELDFLIENCDDAILANMLKSQQSKRSRLKREQKTLDQFMSLMTGAVAEHLLRVFMNKPKNAVTYTQRSGPVEYTEEYLESLRDDQENLRRELRNLQSKKSIYKRKEGFNEDEPDEYFTNLLRIEEELKSRRVTERQPRTDTMKAKLNTLLGDKEATDLKPAEAKKLLLELLNQHVGDKPADN